MDHTDAVLLDKLRYATEIGVGVPMPVDLRSEPTLARFERNGWIAIEPSEDNGRGGCGWITDAGRKALKG